MTKLEYKRLQVYLRLKEFERSHYGFSRSSWWFVKTKTGKFPDELSVKEMKDLLIEVSDYAKEKLCQTNY